jgi:hypothetical protein
MSTFLRHLPRRPPAPAPRRGHRVRPSVEALEERQLLSATLKGDYDGDGRTDMVVFRPNDSTFYMLESRTGFNNSLSVNFDIQPGDVVIRNSDFDGDRRCDMAVWRPSNGTWYYATSANNFSRYWIRQWGTAGDIPLEASDFDGDGRHDLAVYRPSNGTWYVRRSNYGLFNTKFSRPCGAAGDLPLVGSDFDGDGLADMAVWRPGNGTWSALASNYGGVKYVMRERDGVQGDIPLGGTDFDGDGRADMAVWRPSDGTWSALHFFFVDSATTERRWGVAGDLPAVGDRADGRKILYLQFDGASLSRADLERYAGAEWVNDWDVDIDDDGNGVNVSSYRAGRSDRGLIISRTIQLLQADLGHFGITVARLGPGQRAVENQGATTAFVGPTTLTGTGLQGIAGDIDFGNDNRTDICFNLPFGSGSVDKIATRMASLILHEAGHTWGLYHPDAPSTSREAMALSYTVPHGTDVHFTNAYYTSSHDPRLRQNSYQVMMAWAYGAPSGQTIGWPGGPGAESVARPSGCGCPLCGGQANRPTEARDGLPEASAVSTLSLGGSGEMRQGGGPIPPAPVLKPGRARLVLAGAPQRHRAGAAGIPYDVWLVEIAQAQGLSRSSFLADLTGGEDDRPFVPQDVL